MMSDMFGISGMIAPFQGFLRRLSIIYVERCPTVRDYALSGLACRNL